MTADDDYGIPGFATRSDPAQIVLNHHPDVNPPVLPKAPRCARSGLAAT